MPTYLEDLKIDHDNNFKAIMVTSQEFTFPSAVYAVRFREMCMSRAMNLLGLDPMQIINSSGEQVFAEKRLEVEMDKRGIRIEDWSETDHEDWKRGLYIYKDGEVAYFISMIKLYRGVHSVTTNVKFPD